MAKTWQVLWYLVRKDNLEIASPRFELKNIKRVGLDMPRLLTIIYLPSALVTLDQACSNLGSLNTLCFAIFT
jgi:hypothetical protein